MMDWKDALVVCHTTFRKPWTKQQMSDYCERLSVVQIGVGKQIELKADYMGEEREGKRQSKSF